MFVREFRTPKTLPALDESLRKKLLARASKRRRLPADVIAEPGGTEYECCSATRS
jgi:hypothetical protein